MGLSIKLVAKVVVCSRGARRRVRFGRALLRPHVRLAILIEPFRGLDRTKRGQLLANARRHWRASTLLCITHDVERNRGFARVLVLEGGRVVEDGSPATLRAAPILAAPCWMRINWCATACGRGRTGASLAGRWQTG